MIIQRYEKDIFNISDLIDLCTESIVYCCRNDYSKEQIDYWKEHLIPDILRSINLHSENYSGLVAIENEEIAGICFLDLTDNKIKGLYVKPIFLNKKIGKKLMIEIEKLAKLKGINDLELDASINAVEFYKSIGYSPVCKTSCSIASCTVPEVPSIKMKKGLTLVNIN